jgi:hypothetical protein
MTESTVAAEAAYVMTARLRRELREGVDGEGWDEEEKARCRALVDSVPDGATIPDDRTEEDEESDEGQGLPGLIEYFGVEHLAVPPKPRAGKRRNMPRGEGAANDAQTGPAVDSTLTAPTTAEGPVSTAETAPRYVADEDVVRELAAGITNAREAGFSRASLAELLGMTGRNAIWRTEVAGKVQADEVDPIRKLLARVKSGELKPPERRAAGAGGSKPPRASRAELEAKLDAVARLLHAEWRAIKPASFRDALADVVGAPKGEEAAK